MLTVLEALNLSTEYLDNKSIESPRLNAELLLAKILNCKRLELYLNYDRNLTEKEKNTYRNFISRRGKNEPLQYITGEVEFYGIELQVNNNVLIPRPETEILIDTILEKVDKERELMILDIGSGSGNIAIALAKNLTNAKIVSIDVSENALEVARNNALQNELETRIEFIRLNILSDNLEDLSNFDIIVSNPPYVSNEEFGGLQKEILDYEPHEAVTDFGDGFVFFRKISEIGKSLQNKSGYLFFEAAQGQSETIKKIMTENGYSNIDTVKDYADINRVIMGMKK